MVTLFTLLLLKWDLFLNAILETNRILSQNIFFPLRAQPLPVSVIPQTDNMVRLRKLHLDFISLFDVTYCFLLFLLPFLVVSILRILSQRLHFQARQTSYFNKQFLVILERDVAILQNLRLFYPGVSSLPPLFIISTMYSQDKFTSKLLSSNIRPDGREPLIEREKKVLFLPSKGHLIFQQGETSVIIKSNMEIAAPKNERPSQGSVFFRVDCSAANGNYEQQKKLATEASKLLQTVVVGSKALDPESLCILSGRYVWKVTVECSVCIDDGNILDCLINGTILSLMDIRKPLLKFEKDKLIVNEEVQQGLNLAHIPTSISFILTENNLLADSTASEERVSKSRLTISMNVYKELCCIHKPGGMGISQDILTGCLKLAQQRVKTTTDWMRNILRERPLFEQSF